MLVVGFEMVDHSLLKLWQLGYSLLQRHTVVNQHLQQDKGVSAAGRGSVCGLLRKGSGGAR
jgi:hypothetical protein